MEISANLNRLHQSVQMVLTRRTRAQYIGCLDIDNLGDVAVFLAIQDIFAHDVAFATRRVPQKLSNAIGDYINPHAIFLGGGTLIKKSRKYLKQMNDSKRLYPEAKTIIFGTGVGDIDMWNQFGIPTDVSGWCEALEQADYVSVRGPISQAHLKKWGLKREVPAIGDPAVWFARDRITPKRRQMRIGLNLGSTRGQLHGQDDNRVLEFGANFLKKLDTDGWEITLFPVIESDVTFLKQVVEQAGIDMPPMHMDFLNVAATVAALEQQDVFVGEKLHSVILANCAYTPAIMLEYRTKCRDYMQSVDQLEWNVRTDALDTDQIYEKVRALYDDLNGHQARLYTTLQAQKADLRQAAQEVITILNQ